MARPTKLSALVPVAALVLGLPAAPRPWTSRRSDCRPHISTTTERFRFDVSPKAPSKY